jgi:isocitrate dehydrogenase kinase/phosphatase
MGETSHDQDLQDLARLGAASVLESYGAYRAEFKHVTRRAPLRFERRDWHGAHADALERLELRPRRVGRAVEALQRVLGPAAADRRLRADLKAAYDRALEGRPDAEVARTFFNSVTRRAFGTVGVDPASEFVNGGLEPQAASPPAGGEPVFRTYLRQATIADAVRTVLRGHALAVPYSDLDGDARLVAAEVEAFLRGWDGAGRALDAIEVLKPVFYRGQGAYLVGRLRHGAAFSPFILSLLHGDGGVSVDAVLLAPQDASILFSYTRSYFHVDVDHTSALIAFLKSILPQKRTSELYIAIGHHKHGKTVLYREMVEHLARTHERFELAAGERGMVMVVFTLPSLDFVFKVIRDRFAPPKAVTRQEVMQKYALVFRHDRAGRLVDAQEFEDLVVDRARFEPAVLDELLREAGEAVRAEGEKVFIRHLYVERRVMPLDLFIRQRPAQAAREALLDYGRAIRDLAATNTFPGDLLLKNFGVTRNGRVIFYDYDELCLVTDCNFREIPAARDPDDETRGEPWFYVGERDVFPEEFLRFLGLPEGLAGPFLAAHGDILTADFWRRMQARHRAGEMVDIFPYAASRRLRRLPDPIALAK